MATGLLDESDPDPLGETLGEAHACDVVLLDRLGEGAFSTIYEGRWRGTRVAVKMLISGAAMQLRATAPLGGGTVFHSLLLGGNREALLHEVGVLSSLRHPCIVAIYAVVMEPPMLIMELASQGSLAQLLSAPGCSLLLSEGLDILSCVACGVEYLHRQRPPVAHRDLKSANVLLSDGAVRARVADFGLSAWVIAVGNAGLQRVGTPAYLAPEVARGELVTDWLAVDSYGVGLIAMDVAHATCHGGRATSASSLSSILDADLHCSHLLRGESLVLDTREREGYRVEVDGSVDARLADLIRACTQVAPGDRPKLTAIREVLEGISSGNATL